MSPGSLVLLPGLGANRRLFAPQIGRFGDHPTIVPEWPRAFNPRLGVEALADRLRTVLAARGALDPRSVLVGFSFGGQVALSMARQTVEAGDPAPRAIVLVSGVRRTSQLTARFRLQVAGSRLLPDAAIAFAASGLVAKPFARACGLDHEQALELQRMAAELDVPTFRRLARAACRWTFEEGDEHRLVEAGVRIHHLHSLRDPVIPPPPADAAFDAIAEPAHLLTWTHESLVRRTIEDALSAAAD